MEGLLSRGVLLSRGLEVERKSRLQVLLHTIAMVQAPGVIKLSLGIPRGSSFGKIM